MKTKKKKKNYYYNNYVLSYYILVFSEIRYVVVGVGSPGWSGGGCSGLGVAAGVPPSSSSSGLNSGSSSPRTLKNNENIKT